LRPSDAGSPRRNSQDAFVIGTKHRAAPPETGLRESQGQ
jgi:hypothetical protein